MRREWGSVNGALGAATRGAGPHPRRWGWRTHKVTHNRTSARPPSNDFDLGVEHGIAAVAANGLTKATKTQRAIAERIVQDVLRTGVSRDDAVRAAVLAVWGLLGAKTGRSSDTSER